MTEQDLSPNAHRVYQRYVKGYVRPDQLLRYYELNYITQEEYEFIKSQEQQVF